LQEPMYHPKLGLQERTIGYRWAISATTRHQAVQIIKVKFLELLSVDYTVSKDHHRVRQPLVT